MMLYDCFVFHNEFDLLEIRLREMGDLVDRFVLVEADQTQRGSPKPFFFDENRERFSAWKDKIVDLQVRLPDELPPALGVYKNRRKKDWERENYQRNCIAQGLDTCRPDDLVLLSDVDEIIRADVLDRVPPEAKRIVCLCRRCATGRTDPEHVTQKTDERLSRRK